MVDMIARYVYEVYRQKSVSLAAKKLFMTQPAMSSAVRKAEQELGAPIFNRKTLPFSLTEEGKVYIETVEKMLQMESRAEDRIRDIRQTRGGILRIATSTHVSYRVLPEVLKHFRREYPQVDVHILVTDSDKLYEQLDKNLADLAVIPLETPPEGYTAHTLFVQKMAVVLPREIPAGPRLQSFQITREELLAGSYSAEKEITDLSVFEGIDFIYSPSNSYIHKKRTLLLGKSGITPYITPSAERLQLNYNLMLSGFGALFTTDAAIATMPHHPGCRYFILGGADARQDFSLVLPDRESARNHALCQAFIQTAGAVFRTASPLKAISESEG